MTCSNPEAFMLTRKHVSKTYPSDLLESLKHFSMDCYDGQAIINSLAFVWVS